MNRWHSLRENTVPAKEATLDSERKSGIVPCHTVNAALLATADAEVFAQLFCRGARQHDHSPRYLGRAGCGPPPVRLAVQTQTQHTNAACPWTALATCAFVPVCAWDIMVNHFLFWRLQTIQKIVRLVTFLRRQHITVGSSAQGGNKDDTHSSWDVCRG